MKDIKTESMNTLAGLDSESYEKHLLEIYKAYTQTVERVSRGERP